jgi:two-component system, sensor histidine kinase and response regulator
MKKIVVIEDELLIREGISEFLTFEGYEVFKAENGQVGVDLVAKNLPDLILCDIRMPLMDGYEVRRQLEQDEKMKLIPFVFLTAMVERPDIRTGMELGASDYLTKPFTHEELLKTIKRQIGRQEEFKKQKKEALDELRSNIISHLPHELRTPLNALVGYGQLLMECTNDFDAAMIRDAGQDIFTSAMRLFRMIQNYLIYTRLELNKNVPVTRSELEKTGEICENAARKMAKENLRPKDLECTKCTANVWMPVDEFTKIVEELTDNAFKFSQNDQTVKVTCNADKMTFRLIVEDQGRGMTPEKIGEIGAYNQFDRKIYEQQGAGLGLVLVKKITELYGGSLHIQSEQGKGTKVIVVFPLLN